MDSLDLERADPIFLHGVLPRSGTNFLWDILRLHTDVAPARAPIREDFLLKHAHHLEAYAKAVRYHWQGRWGDYPDDITDQVQAAIGRGLVSFLWTERDKRLLTKTPSVENLRRFSVLFPDARLVVLVRDGRSVVQSGMTSFGWDLDTGARRWRSAVEEIRAFERVGAIPYLLIRYEDLLADTKATVKELLDFLNLDPGGIDLEAAARVPVRGSSEFHGAARHDVHWEPVARDESFKPTERWRSWDRSTLERFAWIAGDQLAYLRYESEPVPTGAASLAEHRLRDGAWQARRALRFAGKRLGRRSAAPLP